MNTTIRPKIAVIGAGAIGSLIGALLARDGEDVMLIGKKDHVEAIRKDGLAVDGAAGAFCVKVKAAEKLNFRPDMAFIAVKNQDVTSTCRDIRSYIGQVPVVIMQNGVAAAETAASFFGKSNIITCTLVLNARFLSPGKVTYVKQNPIVIGKAYAQNDASVQQLQTLLGKVAATTISDHIIGVQWTKLLINAMTNALDGMSGLSLGKYMRYPEMFKIGMWILREAFRLADQAGIRLAALPGLPLIFFKLIDRMPSPVAVQFLKLTTQAKGDRDIITSTLQSLLKGKPTEVDYLNGEFVRLGQRLARPAPINTKVVELIHQIEHTHTFYTPAALLETFSALRREN